MKNLELNPTADTPYVLCDIEGKITMKGRSLPENPSAYYAPIFAWAKSYEKKEILLDFKLEYFNTASSKQIFNLIKILVENTIISDIKVKWHYEEGDYDSLETGQHYAHLFRIPFDFIEYAETEM